MSLETSMERRRQATPEKLQDRPVVSPAVDIHESPDEVLLVADLPGVEKEDLSIHFEKGQLTIGGSRREIEGKQRISGEFRMADYRRTFLVPQGIDADRISAELKHGVLTVHLPKQESMRPKQIQVKSGT